MPEFDHVAPVYDATRRPPTEAEFAAVREALDGARSVLEVGVGTGRYSVPLGQAGFRMTGIDLSTEMMRLARGKGVERLVKGDLHRLPFRDASFDAGLIVHVLQLIPDPFAALGELLRVARSEVVAVFPERTPFSGGDLHGFRKRYRELAAERGIELPPRPRYWENGKKLLEAVPPASLRRVEEPPRSDPEVRRAWSDLRAFGGFAGVPEEVHNQILEQIRAERGPRPGPDARRLRVLQVATWKVSERPSFLERAGREASDSPAAAGA
jgi:SAM-dependent methyltransferase